ncbi:MAG: sulfite exporter TauE/SafE family protein [Candidatus Rokubacteria bacterium]|nr:sulfite exporter TauE/SafE family protein [Candidatus Rokubacteria bacterium]
MSPLATWALTTAVVAVSAAVQALTGFGFAVVAVPFLVVLNDPRDAVALSTLLSTVGVATMWWRTRGQAPARMMRWLAVGGLAGLPAGILVLLRLDVSWLKLGAGLLSLGLGVVLLSVGVERPVLRASGTGSGADEPRPPGALVAGLLSGFLAGSLSMPGPPLMVLLHQEQVLKQAYRATSFAYFVLIYPVAALAMVATGVVSSAVLVSSITHLPAMLLGTAVGDAGHDMLSQRHFTIAALLLLCAGGVAGAMAGISALVGRL